MPVIRSFLDLSTAHLPPRFFEDGATLTGRHPTEHGMLLWVPESADEIRKVGASDDCDDAAPEVVAVRLYARALGCDYILFDGDGPVADELPTFTWGVEL